MQNKELVSFTMPQETDGYYVATLSNGVEVYQDSRPSEAHAWLRLKQFLDQNPSISISGIRLLVKNHSFDMPKDKQGYAFGMKRVATWPMGPNSGSVCVGYCENDVVNLFWISGEGLEISKEQRTKEKAGFFLILNGNN